MIGLLFSYIHITLVAKAIAGKASRLLEQTRQCHQITLFVVIVFFTARHLQKEKGKASFI